MRLSPKPFEDCTVQELKERRRGLFDLYHSMVGTLYPPLVLEEIVELNVVLYRKQTGHTEVAPGVSLRTHEPEVTP